MSGLQLNKHSNSVIPGSEVVGLRFCRYTAVLIASAQNSTGIFAQGAGVLCINLDRDAQLRTFSVYPKK